MANGQGAHDLEAVWKAVDALRSQVQDLSERTAVLRATASDNKEDLNELSKSLARAQVVLENAIAASEDRINQRFDRMRNWAIALVGVSVPIISALIGAIAQGGLGT